MADLVPCDSPPLQYNFTVVEAGCASSCTELVFTSSTKDVALTGLLPGTTVRGVCDSAARVAGRQRCLSC